MTRASEEWRCKVKNITTEKIREEADSLECGKNVLISGTIYTARDAAHKRMIEELDAA